jgi:hypothetical protein
MSACITGCKDFIKVHLANMIDLHKLLIKFSQEKDAYMRTQAKFVCESLISYEFFNLNGFREFSETCDETDNIECDDAVDDFVEVSIIPQHLMQA